MMMLVNLKNFNEINDGRITGVFAMVRFFLGNPFGELCHNFLQKKKRI
jgi:hypothetical protein